LDGVWGGIFGGGVDYLYGNRPPS